MRIAQDLTNITMPIQSSNEYNIVDFKNVLKVVATSHFPTFKDVEAKFYVQTQNTTAGTAKNNVILLCTIGIGKNSVPEISFRQRSTILSNKKSNHRLYMLVYKFYFILISCAS